MKAWLSAAELAGLPGLPGTVQKVNARAQREGWSSRKRVGRGGGREYALSSLPQATRDYLLRARVAQLPAPACAPVVDDLPDAQDLNDRQRETMDARLYICMLIDDMAALTSREDAINALITMARTDQLTPEATQALARANARKGAARTVNRATIYRWMSKRDRGATGLAPRTRKMQPLPAWLPPLLALYQQPQKPTVAECVLEDWPAAYPDAPAPALRTAQRHIAALPVEVREWGRMGRNARRAIQPFIRRTTDGLWPMDIVTVDGHLFKAYARHPQNRNLKLRPELTTYLCIATRKAVGFSAWVAESQHAIWIALGDMVLNPEQGVPALHYSDNGAYRGERHRTTLARIGTSIMFSEAYRAQARGVIERFNSSVWVPLAKKFATYCGDDMDREHLKKQLAIANDDASNLPEWDDFIDQARDALDRYNNRPHRSLGGKTPNEAWAAALAHGWQPTVLDDDDLHDLLPSEERIVSRGEVSLPWGKYYADELRRWHKQTVRVAFNPMHGEQVWVSDDRGRLICLATRDGNAKPYVQDNAMEHGRAQREQTRVRRLERRIERVRAEDAYVPPALYSVPVDPELQQQTAALIEAERTDASAITDERRLHAYWLRIGMRIEAGETVDDEDRRGYTVYRNSQQYVSMEEFFEAFDLTAESFG